MFKIAFSPLYQHPLPAGHRFPMEKYELIPKQLLYEGIITENDLFEPKLAQTEDILHTHTKEYIEQLENLSIDPSHVRRIGFPLSKELVEREKCLIQGTLDCAHFALQDGISMNIAGGTHHAFANRGEGFCLFNDMAFAANMLLVQQKVKRILIVDLDVHQGNGTAAIFKNDERVFTFSMHGGDNYPFHKEQSDLDIPLRAGTEDKEYLNLLEKHFPEVINKFKPEFIFYLCGVDVLTSDKLGKLNLSMDACKKRDELIFKTAKTKQIPVACAMGGGYSPRISDIVDAHCQTFKVALNIFF
ncbi:MAG: histone deacetylase [Bacteroidia bacterium]|nr:histone deacetylase [Bacteroidia bacterium]